MKKYAYQKFANRAKDSTEVIGSSLKCSKIRLPLFSRVKNSSRISQFHMLMSYLPLTFLSTLNSVCLIGVYSFNSPPNLIEFSICWPSSAARNRGGLNATMAGCCLASAAWEKVYFVPVFLGSSRTIC